MRITAALLLLLLLAPGLLAQSIDVSSYVLPVDPASRGAEIAEIHPAWDLDPDAADFGGKKIPALWRSNGLVTGMMGILRFGPAIPAFVCWKEGQTRACPPFHPLAGGARVTRMQSDAVTIRYQPLPGIEVEQTMLVPNARSFRSRALVRSTRAARVDVELHGGTLPQSNTGQIKWPPAPPSESRVEHEGTVYVYLLRAGSGPAQAQSRVETLQLEPGRLHEIEFVVAFGKDEPQARDALRRARIDFFDVQVAQRRKQSEEFYSRVPNFDFGDPRLNLFHRIAWERLRAMAENPAGLIPYRYFMGTSAPWGIDGLWLWDAAFQAGVLHHNDPQWAENLIRNVLAQQAKNGLVPHWTTPHSRSEISQPPLLSWSALRLYTTHGRREFLEEVYPALARLHRWFEAERTRPDGMPFWKQPDESGMDNSPAFDENTDAHVDLAAELLVDARALETIATALGLRSDSTLWRKQADRWRALLDRMWDEQAGFYFPLKGEQRVPVVGVQGFMPLWDPRLPAARRRRLLERLRDPAQFWTPYPIPTVAVNAPQFMQPKWFANTYSSPEAGRMTAAQLEDFSSVYWRGPVWIFSNAIVYEALRESGEYAIANDFGKRMVEMAVQAARHGGMLWENFDPRSGHPSRLLPKGQADELAASIYFVKVLYDIKVGVEPTEPPAPKRLGLRFTTSPTAEVDGLQFGPWTIGIRTGREDFELVVEQAPASGATLSVENASAGPLSVRYASRRYGLAPGRSFTARTP